MQAAFKRLVRRGPVFTTPYCLARARIDEQRMKLSRCMVVAAGLGILIPVAWQGLYAFGPPGLTRNLVSNLFALLFWPSFALLLADPTDSNTWLRVSSTVLNGAYYGVLGGLLWLGSQRPRIGPWPAIGLLLLVAGTMLMWIIGLL